MTERISDQITALELVADQKQQLVDNLSHEMRTPLTSIHGYAEYLLSAPTSEEERIDALMCIMSESERLTKLSQSLLDISYVKNTALAEGKVELLPIFESIGARFNLVAKNLGCELVISDADLCVSGDATLIELLLSNLCDNAIKACRQSEEKKVELSVDQTADGVKLSVTDTGRGMTAEELSCITEPFYRTDKARSRADGGAGLGLALCKRIAEAHGSRLEFSSELGRGTVASVLLSEYKK
jgi:signal transduction histidine kinase